MKAGVALCGCAGSIPLVLPDLRGFGIYWGHVYPR
jgi:hypothetical protein